MKKLLLVLVMLSMLVAVPRVAKAFTMIELMCPALATIVITSITVFEDVTIDWVASRGYTGLDIGMALSKDDPSGLSKTSGELCDCQIPGFSAAVANAAGQHGQKQYNVEVSDYVDANGVPGRLITKFAVGRELDAKDTYQ